MWHKILSIGIFAILSFFSIFFVCVCVIFLYLVFEFTYFYGKKKGIPPRKMSTKMFSSEVKFNKRKQSVVLPTKHNLLKIAKINLQQQNYIKTTTFWWLDPRVARMTTYNGSPVSIRRRKNSVPI